jgi:hypothetical protein
MFQPPRSRTRDTVRDRLKLLLQFDADAMRRDLLCLDPADWMDHFVPQNYEGSWRVLPLRVPAGTIHPIQSMYSNPLCKDFVDTKRLQRCPYIQRVLSTFQGSLFAVRLMKLAPGSSIRPHADHDLAAENETVRIHIPVMTNPDVDFRLNGERVTLREGECWYLRLSDTHSVVNRGVTDRVHLVLDAPLTPWLRARLLEAQEAAENEPLAVVHEESGLGRFRRLVLSDAALQQQLLDIEDHDAFVAAAAQLAMASGCKITTRELDESMRQTRRRWREPVR